MTEQVVRNCYLWSLKNQNPMFRLRKTFKLDAVIKVQTKKSYQTLCLKPSSVLDEQQISQSRKLRERAPKSAQRSQSTECLTLKQAYPSCLFSFRILHHFLPSLCSMWDVCQNWSLPFCPAKEMGEGRFWQLTLKASPKKHNSYAVYRSCGVQSTRDTRSNDTDCSYNANIKPT